MTQDLKAQQAPQVTLKRGKRHCLLFGERGKIEILQSRFQRERKDNDSDPLRAREDGRGFSGRPVAGTLWAPRGGPGFDPLGRELDPTCGN